MNRFTLGVFSVPALLLFLLFAGGRSASDKAATWKPFVPADAYKELTKRSIKTIEATAKGDEKNAAVKVHVEAAILAGYTLAVANAKEPEVARLRGAATVAARVAKEGSVKTLTDLAKMDILAPADIKLLKPRLPGMGALMEIFRNQAKGGEGIHAELQYHPKLKNTNGIETLIGALSAKKLSDENLDKVAKELPNLAYRVAVVGALTYEYAPEKGAGEWRSLSDQMRDASIALAEAAHKKNGEGVLKAAVSLENSCTECHKAFKMK